MGLGFWGTRIIHSSIGKISNAKDACVELEQSIRSSQEKIGESWRGEAAMAMQTALNEILEEINQAYQQLKSAESEVRSRGNYIINNWTDDVEK